MQKLEAYEEAMLASPDQQISLTDPDSRSMATSGRGSGVVGYNVQVAVDTEHHLIIAHEVTNSGSDRAQLANMGKQAKAVLGVDKLEAVADRGYYTGEEIKACADADILVTLPKPNMTGMEAKGTFGKHDFAYWPKRMCIAARLANCWHIGSQQWMANAPFGDTSRKLVEVAY
jgi:transposase